MQAIDQNLKKLGFALLALLFFSFWSCVDQDYVKFQGALVEWDATVLNNPEEGKDYPILGRVPRPGFPVVPADPIINRSVGEVPLRINFVSAQSPSSETINLRVVNEETTAQSGVHYQLTPVATIPPNSSFADLQINIFDPGPSDDPVVLVLELIGNENVKPSENYKRIGIMINQQ